MKKPVFMVVGGNHYNLISVKKAKKLGFKVLVVDKNKKSDSAKLAHYFERADIQDAASVEKIAKKYRIIGTITRNEKAIRTVCYIIKRLGLPNQGIGLGHQLTNKYKLRQAFDKGGVRSVRYYKIENEEEQKSVKKAIAKMLPTIPFIVKPTDLAGGNGVSKVEWVEQYDEAVKTARRSGKNGITLVEEFVEGQEVGAQCLCVDGTMKLCFLSHKTISPDLKTVGHSYPVNLPNDLIKDIKNECRKALKCLGVRNGPTTIDIRISQDNKPYIVDIGARAGGNKLPELIELHSGIDFVMKSIRLASGKSVRIAKYREEPAALLHLHFENSAKVAVIKSYEHLIKKYKPEIFKLWLKPGMKVSSDIQSRGYVICRGDRAARRCASFIRQLKKLIEFE